MRRIGTALFVCVPVAVAGCLVAHQTGYVFEAPDGFARSLELRSDGHAYFREFVFLFAAAMTMLLAGFALAMHAATDASSPLNPSAKPFAAIPVLVFVIQESTERIAAGNLLELFTEVSFVVGLALQVPFGLIAFLFARLILVVAHGVGRIIRTLNERRRPRARSPRTSIRPRETPTAQRSQLLGRAPRRGPPTVFAQPALAF